MSNSSGAQVGARIPADVELHEYQKEAIASWVGENYRGIFDMATGTGKPIPVWVLFQNFQKILMMILL